MKKIIPLLLIIIFINSYIACQDRLIVLWDFKEQPVFKIQAIIRDFSVNHPDFETYANHLSLDLVKEDLGPDNKPVFNSTTGSNQTSPDLTSEATFNQWYNTIDGINHEYVLEIDLIDDTFGMFQYVNTSFFPLKEGQGWGFEGNSNNFHFTTEIHSQFIYNGGEQLTFTGDDDVWIFINKKLVIDLGGVHSVLSKTVYLDDLGLEIGKKYPMDMFHAERHKGQSNFSLQTNISKVY